MPKSEGPHLGAELVTISAYSWVCNICQVESTDLVGDQHMILTMMRMHNQRAKHIGAYGNRAIDRKCPVCNAGINDPCTTTNGKYIFASGFHIERWGEFVPEATMPVRSS